MIVHCTINELNQVGAMCSVHSTDYIREYSSVALLEVSPFPEII